MKFFRNKYAVIMVFILLLISAAIVFSCNADNTKMKTFDKEEWDQYPEKRWMMMDSLEEKHNIIGLKKSEIRELLGGNEILMDNTDMLEYLISPGLGDVEGLLIYFDNDGIAYKYKISEH